MEVCCPFYYSDIAQIWPVVLPPLLLFRNIFCLGQNSNANIWQQLFFPRNSFFPYSPWLDNPSRLNGIPGQSCPMTLDQSIFLAQFRLAASSPLQDCWQRSFPAYPKSLLQRTQPGFLRQAKPSPKSREQHAIQGGSAASNSLRDSY